MNLVAPAGNEMAEHSQDFKSRVSLKPSAHFGEVSDAG
jgi:hypothetical protein